MLLKESVCVRPEAGLIFPVKDDWRLKFKVDFSILLGLEIWVSEISDDGFIDGNDADLWRGELFILIAERMPGEELSWVACKLGIEADRWSDLELGWDAEVRSLVFVWLDEEDVIMEVFEGKLGIDCVLRKDDPDANEDEDPAAVLDEGKLGIDIDLRNAELDAIGDDDSDDEEPWDVLEDGKLDIDAVLRRECWEPDANDDGEPGDLDGKLDIDADFLRDCEPNANDDEDDNDEEDPETCLDGSKFGIDIGRRKDDPDANDDEIWPEEVLVDGKLGIDADLRRVWEPERTLVEPNWLDGLVWWVVLDEDKWLDDNFELRVPPRVDVVLVPEFEVNITIEELNLTVCDPRLSSLAPWQNSMQ